jgi:hypothetical protein
MEDTSIDIDTLLENENQQNKNDSWTKLNKTTKIQKLHSFAEKYGKQHHYSIKEVRLLKHFLSESLDKGKLQKTKDVLYDKTNHEIEDIPGLFFHPTNKNFTLRVDSKRISTLKSLTPKRITEKHKIETETEINK